ncbi:uncharacterized protein [Drosophila bipectinata]|uniref:uncharacterized protein n=1 Tax=Drosophila bipectinata TaxID=42026 RepID=UPI001C8A28A7|nr:E3 ubiquitin-protein ligase RNF128 [Drosophila bipectinata]
MVYMNIVLGLGVVVAAAAAAIWFNWPNYQQTAPHHNHRRNRREEEDEGDSHDPDSKLRSHFGQQQMRRSRPGDKCPVCLDEMLQGDLHMMQCSHAMHPTCFNEFRYLRRSCPLCRKIVNPSLPGDDCPICLDPLTKNDMRFLSCKHAQHNQCLAQYRYSGGKACPICREPDV